MGRFAMTEGEIFWNREETFTVEENEYAAVRKINCLWNFAMAIEPINPY